MSLDNQLNNVEKSNIELSWGDEMTKYCEYCEKEECICEEEEDDDEEGADEVDDATSEISDEQSENDDESTLPDYKEEMNENSNFPSWNQYSKVFGDIYSNWDTVYGGDEVESPRFIEFLKAKKEAKIKAKEESQIRDNIGKAYIVKNCNKSDKKYVKESKNSNSKDSEIEILKLKLKILELEKFELEKSNSDCKKAIVNTNSNNPFIVKNNDEKKVEKKVNNDFCKFFNTKSGCTKNECTKKHIIMICKEWKEARACKYGEKCSFSRHHI